MCTKRAVQHLSESNVSFRSGASECREKFNVTLRETVGWMQLNWPVFKKIFSRTFCIILRVSVSCYLATPNPYHVSVFILN